MRPVEYKVIIPKNEKGNGYWAYCPDLPGCNSTGQTLLEVKSNIKEAIVGYLETLSSLREAIPEPQSDSVYLEAIRVDF